MKDMGKRAGIFLTLVLFILPLVPPVIGDGMPVYTYVTEGGAQELYGTTFESRQLASVEYLNSTHQRIDLFLSIFSLDPRENLTVLVPFRQAPLDVDMKKENDTDFLNEHDYEKIRKESEKQDLERTSDRFMDRTQRTLGDLGTSSVTSPLGLLTLHVARTYVIDQEEGGKGFMDNSPGEGASSSTNEVEEIAHYEFDGASVSIYSVSANATLEEFISVVDLGSLPAITREVVEEYRKQYVAVIETLPSPPIPHETYDWLQETMPGTMEDLLESFSLDGRLTYIEAKELVAQYSYEGFREMVDSGYNMSDMERYEIDYWYHYTDRWEWGHYTPYDIREKMESLIFAVYGFTDFTGHTLSVTTLLDGGDLYFPLGTSKGWDNPIQETIIMARVPKDRSLDPNLDISHSAFIEDEHCYIFEYFDANPEHDLEASIRDVSLCERISSSLSIFLHFNTVWAPLFFGIIFEILLWLLLLQLFMAGSSVKGRKVLTGKNLLVAVLNPIVSAPVTYIFTVEDPFSGKEWIGEAEEKRVFRFVYVTFTVINLCFILLGVFS